MIKVEIMNIVRTFENDKFSSKELRDMINRKSEKDNLIFSEMLINGESFSGDISDIVFEEGDYNINIIFEDLVDYIKSVSFTGYTYVDQNINQIEKFGESFYSEGSSKSWNSILDLVESLTWMTNIMALIHQNTVFLNLNDWNYDEELVNEMVKEFFAAYEMKDDILMGDIILNEILPYFIESKNKFEIIMKKVD